MSKRKLLLAAVRQGDYAHAGEEEAIELSLIGLPKNPKQRLLDVGCGLGGTADYIQKNGWGKVIGIDLDPEVLAYAKQHYPELEFHHCDVVNVGKLFQTSYFDVIYSFNAFYCFQAQEQSLLELAKVAKENAELIIFDYASQNAFHGSSPFYDSTGVATSQNFFPINLATCEAMLDRTGWRLENIVELKQEYKIWYETLSSRMAAKKEELIRQFGSDTFHDLDEGYRRLQKLIDENKVTGAIVQAKKQSKDG